MPAIHPPVAAPCWFEFSSTDAPRSKSFFCALFGWQAEDQDMGPMGTYSFLLHSEGAPIGAMWQMPQAQLEQQIPSNWGVYFKVADLDQSHARAVALGAKEYLAPMNVSNYGRMSVLADPTGAVFSLWQELGEAGSIMMFHEHSVGWIELATRDVPGAREFYQALLGWTYTSSPIPVPGAGDYTEIHVADTRYGGILPMTKEWEGIPPHWGLYFNVASVDASLERGVALGGKVCVPAFDIPNVGRLAVLSEPTGGTFYLITRSD